MPTTDSMLLTKIFKVDNLQINDSHTNSCSNSKLPELSNKSCLYICDNYFLFVCTNFFQRFVNLSDLFITSISIKKEVGDSLCVALCDNLQCSLHYLSISECTFAASFCFKL